MLLLAALAEGTTEIRDLLDSDDTLVMLDALQKSALALRRWAAMHGASRAATACFRSRMPTCSWAMPAPRSGR
jgi:5-enolpyruvylshikimate-3-phosphate synthase